MRSVSRKALLDTLGLLRSPVGKPTRPITVADLQSLASRLRASPREMLLTAPAVLGTSPTLRQALSLLAQAMAALNQPDRAIAEINAAIADRRPYELPERYRFPGYDPETIPITPGVHKFETYADLTAWALTAAAAWVWRAKTKKPAFVRHGPDSTFRYPLPMTGAASTIALFSDWGTGYYHSRYIATHILNKNPDCAIHLGDVYYTGRKFEVADYFEDPLREVVRRMPFFALNANHEMDSHGIPYFAFLKKKAQQGKQRGYARQPQEGSYFCLYSDHYQIIGIDTAFFKNGRHCDEQTKAWLGDRLAEGRADGKINILLSQNEPYSPREKGATELLAKDLASVRHDIDLWFWGDEHYAALYLPKDDRAPFIGSCIGHGGYPYYTLPKGGAKNDLVETTWEENGTRFPEDLKVRADVGSNGWCMLDLTPQLVTLTYYDWIQRKRHHKSFRVRNHRLEI